MNDYNENVFDGVRSELHAILDQRATGTIGQALLTGNKVLFALQVIEGDADITKQEFTVLVDRKPLIETASKL